MNTPSKIISTLALAVAAGLSLAQAAQAAPRTYGPRDTVRFERLAESREPCDPVVAHRWNGSTKQREAVEICARAPARTTSIKRWVGPRNTVPVR